MFNVSYDAFNAKHFFFSQGNISNLFVFPPPPRSLSLFQIQKNSIIIKAMVIRCEIHNEEPISDEESERDGNSSRA